MIKHFQILTCLHLFACSLVALPVNHIDKDPWLKSWLFVGPIENYDSAIWLSDSLSNSSFQEIKEFVLKDPDLVSHEITSKSSTGRHSIYQYFPDSHGELVLGFCSINSKTSETAFYNHNIHPWDNISSYLNNDLVVENSSEPYNWHEISLVAGENNFRLIFPLRPKGISFNNNYRNDFSIGLFKKEFATAIKGKLTHKRLPVKDASINFSTPLGLSFTVQSDEKGRFEASIINQAFNEQVSIYINKNNLKYSSILNLNKKNPSSNLNIELEEYYDSISGKIFTLFEDKPQSNVLVKLKDTNNKKVISKVFSENSGNFEFQRVPKGTYNVYIETDGNVQYFKYKNNQIAEISIGSNKEQVDNINFKIPQINRGIWEQLNFIKGLKSDYVFDIHVDNQNRIWFACHTGLSVYDGNKYKNFGKKEGLRGGAVVKIFEDSKGLIWILERHEYVGTGSIKIINDNYEIENFAKKYDIDEIGFNSIGEDNMGNIIFGGSSGLFIYNGKDIQNIRYGDGLGSGHITDILIDKDSYWLGTTDGLIHFNGSNYNYKGINEGLGINTYIRKISKSPKGDLLICTGHQNDFGDSNESFTMSLYSYDGLSFNPNEDVNHTSNINDILFNADIMFYNSNNKIVLYSDQSQQSISPFWSTNTSVGFGVTCFEKTKDGNIFIGTIGGGAWKYNEKSVNTISSVDGFPDEWAWNMVTDNENNLWAATQNGLIKVADGKILKVYNQETNFPVQRVTDVDLDNFGNIWASSTGGLVNIVGDKILVYDQENGLENNNLASLSINSRGGIWTNAQGVLSYFDGTKFQNYNSDIDSILIFGDNSGLLALDNGDVLFGGGGFNLFSPNKEKNRFTRLAEAEWVNEINIDTEGNIIYSSVNEGLVQFSDGKKSSLYDPENGFLFQVPMSSYVDKNDWIWSSSESGGVGFYDGNSWSYLTKDDGILANRTHKITSDNIGTYYFSHVGGITAYKPQKEKGFVSIDKVSTTKLDYTNLDSQLMKSIVNERIRISFIARNYNSSKNKFKYSIVRGEKELSSQIIDNPYFEWYPNKTGNYKLSVQSIDRDLNYSNPKVLSISILNPWYIRSTFLIPFFGFLSVIFYTTYFAMSKFIKQKEFNEKLRLNAQKRDKEARLALEDKNKDLVESQKAAEAANEAKSTFLANMSHELRTPLNAIIGYSEMLIEDAEDENEDFIPDLDKINSSGKHLLGLINDILDLSKVESGKMELFIEEFNLEKILNEVSATITPLVEKNNNSLNLTINTKTKSISADITKIRQILLNLLSNATKFTKEGEIDIIVNDNPDNTSLLDFKVSDSGIGMKPEQVDKVFKPFTQADEKTTRKFGGTGLGLTITKMFAEMMGGGIDLSSIINEGTTFTVSIPKFVIDPKKVKDKIGDISTKPLDSSFTILVIDDDANAQELMKKFLSKENYSVLQATSGPAGLDLAAKHLPDLITLDVMMPEMDGWEVLAALQNNDTTKNIPVIMLTMANEPDIGYSLGATDYLTKPVDWGRLSSILEKHEIETSSQSILIVEDDEITRGMLKKSLETNEFKVSVAKNGKEGLEKVKKAKPALILLDLMMPEMDGFEFAEELREKKEWLDIPVVVITAKDLTSDDHSRLKGNVEAIMQKGSYSRDELLSEVGQRIKRLNEEV